MMIRSIGRCSAAAMLLFFGLASPGQAEDPVFRAGAARLDATPEHLPAVVNGSMLERLVEEVNDPLHVRAVVMDDGTTRIAMVLVDSCMMPRDLLDKAKEMAETQTGIPAENILISATHCHSAPSVIAVLGTGVDERYVLFLPARIAKAIELANANLQPAQIGFAMGRDEVNVATRRWLMKEGVAPTNPFGGTRNDRARMHPGYNNPDAIRETGLEDPDVPVISLQTKQGKQIAFMSAYSMHYAGAPNISADYFGLFAGIIEEKLPSGNEERPTVAMIANGTSGDTWLADYKRSERRKFDRFTVAEDVSAAALKAFETIEYHQWLPLRMVEKELEVAVRFPTEDEIQVAQEYVSEWAAERKPKTTEEVYALETLILSKMPKTRMITLQAIRIGTLGIGAIPNEVFAETGLNIKKYSPFKMTYTISLANGAFGYIPPPEQHALGGYTTWRARSSCLGIYAEPLIKYEVLELLEKAKGVDK